MIGPPVPSEDKRERIERALGKPLSEVVWLKIWAVTGDSVMREGDYNESIASKTFIKMLRQLNRNAESLTREINKLTFPTVGPTWKIPEGGKFVRVPLGKGRQALVDIVERHFQLEVPRGKYENELSLFSLLDWTLEALRVVTEFVIQEVSRPDYSAFRVGDLWNLWIAALTLIKNLGNWLLQSASSPSFIAFTVKNIKRGFLCSLA